MKPQTSLSRPSRWGMYWLGFTAFASFLALLWRPVGYHYLVFTGAAKAFWQHEPIYGAYGKIHEGFFYSPTCAAFFYSAFAFLPSVWGRAIYVLLSLTLLAWSIRYFLRTYQHTFGVPFGATSLEQSLWLLASSELIGAILAEKLEITILALFFLALSLSWQKRFFPATFLLCLVGNWKFQSYPILGLLLLVAANEKRSWRLFLGVGVFLAGLYLAPFTVQDPTYLLSEMAQWKTSLDTYMRSDWMSPIYHHAYAFPHKVLKLPISFDVAGLISTGFGLIFALVLFHQWKVRKEGFALAVMTAFGLGAAFTVLFSPLSQGTGYSIYLPLPLLLLIQNRTYQTDSRKLLAVILVGYFLVSLSTSDFVPRGLRWVFYSNGVKALGASLFVTWFFIIEFQRASTLRCVSKMVSAPHRTDPK
jgi:hypothetical protein